MPGKNGKQQQTNSAKRVVGRPFPKGVSGNPKGRPPGPGLMAQLQSLMDDDDGSKRWALVQALYAKALEGDMHAMRLILDRTDPAPKNDLTINNNIMTASGIREYLDSTEVRPIKARANGKRNGAT